MSSKHIAVIGSRNFCGLHIGYEVAGLRALRAWSLDDYLRRCSRYAVEHGVEFKLFPADWDTHGKKAGFLRNITMARGCAMVLAFWDMQSSGTAHMIQTALQHGKPVTIVPLVVGKKIRMV